MLGEGSSREGVVDVDLSARADMVAGASKSSSKLIAITHGDKDIVLVFSCAWVGASEKKWQAVHEMW